MTEIVQLNAETRRGLIAAIEEAGRQIPPLWPLSATVAVNPFLGQSGQSLAVAGARLARVAGADVTMPRRWYLERIEAGEITDDDLEAALAASPHPHRPAGVAALKAQAAQECNPRSAVPTVADLTASASGIDWPGLVADRIGLWAAGHFDRGQALWSAPRDRSAWAAWRAWATHDLTPEILGLAGFAARAVDAPACPIEAIAQSLEALGVDDAATGTYLHRLLISLGGWAQYARGEAWRAQLEGRTDDSLRDLLAIRLFWEAALFRHHEARLADDWLGARAQYAQPVAPDEDQIVGEILQEAAERAAQRRISAALAASAAESVDARPALQAAFCIDVRSEVFRRALESVDTGIRTLGFAGFFGIAVQHRGFASDVPEHRLPVLLAPALQSRSGPVGVPSAQAARFTARARRAWGRFKLAAVSSFAFVEAAGPLYLGKLVRDAAGLAPPEVPSGPAPRLETELDVTARVDAAETVLRAMSLTGGFARVVLLAGHGAGVTNNPHGSALQCGACGGHSGEVNARLLAGLLNDSEVRHALRERGIAIPADTLFLAALHDTTTDEVTLYDRDTASTGHASDLVQARGWLAEAGRIARRERAPRLPGAAMPEAIPARARDWAEVRPEWGLAGCQAFIAAPRARTLGSRLGGRAFLHDYDWTLDRERDFKVLELILTAPVVVASWISLQYYGSTVAPGTFGSGDKLLHNVVGGIGVVEGNGGMLRAGLPWQSVHDGTDLVHEPLRLAVYVEAPCEAMSGILSRHPEVRALFDNRWLHLLALDGAGRTIARYAGGLSWIETSTADRAAA